QNYKDPCPLDKRQDQMSSANLLQTVYCVWGISLFGIPVLLPVWTVQPGYYGKGYSHFLFPAIPVQYYTRRVLHGYNRFAGHCSMRIRGIKALFQKRYYFPAAQKPVSS